MISACGLLVSISLFHIMRRSPYYFSAHANTTIGDEERETIAFCTKSGRGARVIPNGTLKGVHFVKTPDYVQVTGVGDFTKINIRKADAGGELDDRGADGVKFTLLSFCSCQS